MENKRDNKNWHRSELYSKNIKNISKSTQQVFKQFVLFHSAQKRVVESVFFYVWHLPEVLLFSYSFLLLLNVYIHYIYMHSLVDVLT